MTSIPAFLWKARVWTGRGGDVARYSVGRNNRCDDKEIFCKMLLGNVF
jgi:hypothetical protein